MLKKLLKSGLLKALPLSSVIEEVIATVKEVKEQNNYKRLIKLGAYLIVGAILWVLILKGFITFAEALELIKHIV